MKRPWVTPQEVIDYSDSAKVSEREAAKLKFDIARAEKYVIFYTHNRFDSEEYEKEIPEDIRMAVILLADAYAKQAISARDGSMKSETFDDYSYTVKDEAEDVEAGLNLGYLLDDYILEDKGKITMKLRKL